MKWGYAAQNPTSAYTADIPTLLQYDALYGSGSSAYWVETQLTGLYGASVSKETGVVDGISIFCQSFAAQVQSYKLSELLLFFARYKAGRYDNSYSSFDPRRIGNAFFKEFIPERNRELEKINRERKAQEIESRRYTPPDGYTSRSWYEELKKRAASGDKDAIRQLTTK